MDSILLWWFWVVAAGWLVYPLLFRGLTLLPDRGLAASKLAGLMLAALGAAWIRFLRNQMGCEESGYSLLPEAAAGAALLVFNALLLRRRGRAIVDFLASGGWRVALGTEAAFAAAFLAYLWLRSHFPDATYDVNFYAAEKWVNLTTLTGIWRNGVIPAQDPWLAGLPMNYYYFSHLIWAMLARLSGTAPEVAFNLGLGTVFALLVTLSFSAGWALSERRRGGFMAVFLVAFAGPLAAWEQAPMLLKMARDGRDWLDVFRSFSFWEPSDVLPFTRNEFPCFNWLLGDLHAHATGFLLLLLAVCLLAHLQRARELEASSWRGLAWGQFWSCWLLTLTLAAMWMTNSWDVLVAGMLCAAWIVSEAFRENGWRDALGEALQGLIGLALAGAVAVKIIAVFFTAYISMPLDFSHAPSLAKLPAPFSALAAVGRVTAGSHTTLAQWALFWGLFTGPLLFLLAARAWRRHRWRWLDTPWTALFVIWIASAIVLPHQVESLPRAGLLLLLALVAVTAYLMDAQRAGRLQTPEQWALLLALVALVCQTAPEFFYLDDPIGSDDSPTGRALQRYNTVFKFYYPAWGLLALSLAVLCRNAFRSPASSGHDFEASAPLFDWRALGRPATLAALTMVAAGGLYPVLGCASRLAAAQYREVEWRAHQPVTRRDSRFFYRTLDGLGFMRLPQYGVRDEWELGLWMRSNLKGKGYLAEASGASYCSTGRFAALTGIPCVLGWESHETQWRGNAFLAKIYQERVDALARIYESENIVEKRAACRGLGVRWVVLGGLERERYAGPGVEKVTGLGKILKRVGETLVIEVE